MTIRPIPWSNFSASSLQGSNVAADFIAMRYTTKALLGNHSRGFQTTCGTMEDVVEELAEDVGKWLYKPTMNAKLGDLAPR